MLVKGHVFMRWCLAAANRTHWPLLSRRFYLARGYSKVGQCASMALADTKFGFKMRSLQSRWALGVLLGSPPGRLASDVGPATVRQILVDLGWASLWASCAASAVALYCSMKADLPLLAHTRAANAVQAAPGTWLEAVRKLMTRYAIVPWHPDAGVSPGTAEWNLSLRSHRRRVVLPTLRKHHLALGQRPLPWGWIAIQGGQAFSRRSFEAWWHVRTFRGLGWLARRGVDCSYCCLCSGPAEDLRQHLQETCPVFSLRGAVEGWDPRLCFETPSDPRRFTAVLIAMDSFVDGWPQNRRHND